MNELESTVKKYVVNHYGDLIIPDTPVYDDMTKTWMVQLGSTYPRIIEDEVSKEVLVGYLDLKELGMIKLNDQLEIIDATPSNLCDDNLSYRLDFWKQQTERIVIIGSSYVFAKIEESNHVFHPLELILDRLIDTTRDSEIKITDNEISEQRKSHRIRQYLDLLLELKIVRRTQGGYVHGNTYVGLVEKVQNNPPKLRTVLLSHIIQQKYSTLRQVFGIAQLEPFVHLANTYYSASLEAEKLIHMSKQHLYQRYQDFYKRISDWEFESKLHELIDKGAFQYEQNYLIGNEEYFDNMLELKQKVQLNPIT